MEINLQLTRGKVSENPLHNDSDAFTRASTRTSLRPIDHLVKITKKRTFCFEQTYQHLLVVDRWSRGTKSPKTRSFFNYVTQDSKNKIYLIYFWYVYSSSCYCGLSLYQAEMVCSISLNNQWKNLSIHCWWDLQPLFAIFLILVKIEMLWNFKW